MGESEQGGVGELEWERKTSTASRTGQAWVVGVGEDGQDARLAVRGKDRAEMLLKILIMLLRKAKMLASHAANGLKMLAQMLQYARAFPAYANMLQNMRQHAREVPVDLFFFRVSNLRINLYQRQP